MSPLAVAVDVVVAAGALVAARRFTRGRGKVAAGFGIVIVGTAAWLMSQTVDAGLRAFLAVAGGLGAGIVAGGIRVRDRDADSEAPRRPRTTLAVVAVALVATLGLGGWIGGNSPSRTWFGPIVSHGDRHGSAVAITFDDGPNISESLVVAHILDSFGAKGTFFTVGKALDARPDISRALLADGQLLGNHSYHHDQWRWLDPRYPELERTQAAFRRRLAGICPTFYRPPHGEHTPFMSYELARKHMTMVGWDTSAADWATTDGALVARRILGHVRPGSIIVLHDGLDGNPTADRSVLTIALPIIMRGLRAKGLHAVRLDQLLHISPYGASHC